MLKARMKYGAVSAKIMAMYGKRLREDDWQRLSECKSYAEICAFLRSHRGWSQTMASLPTTPTPKVLQAAVRKRVYEDYEKLYKFLQIEDQQFLKFTAYRAEYDYILDALREKGPMELLPKTLELTDFMRKNSSVDLAALEQSRNFAEIQSAVKGSIYEKPLAELKLNPETGQPNYWETGVLLENAFFKAIFSYISGKYKGFGQKNLSKTLGMEADLLNIVSILRLQRSFPQSLEQAGELLIPISYRLKPELLYALESAKSEDEALEILRKSDFGKYLVGTDTTKIESIYYKTMEKFCRKLLKTAEPDLNTPQVYLVLKGLECEKLSRVIEAVYSGVDPKSVI